MGQSGVSQNSEVTWDFRQENEIQGICEIDVGELKKPKGGIQILQRLWLWGKSHHCSIKGTMGEGGVTRTT